MARIMHRAAPAGRSVSHDHEPSSFVSFGEQGAQLTYGSYLRLPQLLDSQHLESDPPAHDELLFITIHQVYELWFKQLLHEVDAARDAMSTRRPAGRWAPAPAAAACTSSSGVLVQQIDVLETMTPQDFLEFRQRLAPASGFQSVQFRELEFLSGAKDPSYVDRFRGLTDDEQQRLRAPARRADPLGRASSTCSARAGLPADDDAAVSASLRTVAHDRSELRRDLGAGRGAAPARRARRELAGPARGDGRADDRHQVRHRRLERLDVPAQPAADCATTRCSGTCASEL